MLTKNTPHIVKFSGGRSSGMMLIELLEQGKLNPKRGDVIIFNNTSAEHHATYEFTRKIKTLAEEKYNIPFFWIEHQTYEDANRSYFWVRKPTYRLVNENPYSKDNPNGYRYKGEVFEELISYTGSLPNMLSRTCTLSMKIFTTNNFLVDWLAQKAGIERLGHYGENSKIKNDSIVSCHKKNGGKTPDAILLAKREFLQKCTFVRESQNWSDFTRADIVIDNAQLKQGVLGDKAQLYGELAIDYVSYLGIRKDEERRIKKIQARIDAVKNNERSLSGQPPLEHIVAPLVDKNITQQNVTDFWHKQSFNLDLPDSGLFSNCVYCPLKGRAKLLKIAQNEVSNGRHDKPTSNPASIDWWIEMENKYSRNLKKEGRKILSEKRDPSFVGFFGSVDNFVFPAIKKQAMAEKNGEDIKAEFLENEDYVPCNCTD